MPPSTDPGVGIFPRCLMIIRIAVDRQLSLTVLKHGGEWQKIDRWRNSLILSRTPFLQLGEIYYSDVSKTKHCLLGSFSNKSRNTQCQARCALILLGIFPQQCILANIKFLENIFCGIFSPYLTLGPQLTPFLLVAAGLGGWR